MTLRFKELLDTMDISELKRLNTDLIQGGKATKKMVEATLGQKEIAHSQECAICGAIIGHESENALTLVFDTASVRKKASFCAIDYLLYFINQMKKTKPKITN